MAINNRTQKLIDKLLNPQRTMYYHIKDESLEVHYYDSSKIMIPDIEHNREALNRKIIAGILEEYESVKELRKLLKTVLGMGITIWIFLNMVIPLPTILTGILTGLGIAVFSKINAPLKFSSKQLSFLEYVSTHLEEINQTITPEDVLQLESHKYDAYMEHEGITVGNIRLFASDKILTKARGERNGKRRH